VWGGVNWCLLMGTLFTASRTRVRDHGRYVEKLAGATRPKPHRHRGHRKTGHN
jgi:hypothetical protein